MAELGFKLAPPGSSINSAMEPQSLVLGYVADCQTVQTLSFNLDQIKSILTDYLDR